MQLNKVKIYILLTQYLIEIFGKKVEQKQKY